MSGFRLRRRRETPVSELQRRSNPLRIGAIFLVVVVVAVYFGFTKHVPFKHGFRLNAVFSSALDIAPKAPVRIAGVAVGKVTSIRREGHAGLVSMEIEGKGLPIHADATAKIRERIFLEGNWFVELQPGTPAAHVVSSGYTIPVTHTADPVQFDQLLDALNTDTRANLQTFLIEYGAALTAAPTPAENAEQAPEVHGLNAAQALNKAFRSGPEALRTGSIINQALLGTRPDDIPKLIDSLEGITGQLAVHEQQLGELFGHFNSFLHSFAAQAPSVRAAVAELPRALRGTERGFAELEGAAPSIQAFALDIIPGVETIPATAAAAYPWIEQLQAALGPRELGGVAAGLSAAAPAIAGSLGNLSAFQGQYESFNECLTRVFYPTIKAKLEDGANTTGAETYKEFWYALAGLAGNGQNFDGNGAGGRFIAGGSGTTVLSPPPTVVKPGAPAGTKTLVAQAALTPEGTSPRFPGSEPPYRPLVPCATQTVPNLNGPLAHGPADGGG